MQRQITRGTKIVLEAVHDKDALKNPLFAINWFNTRSLWLYNIYNKIASRSLFGVGGKVLFKGRVTETLLGSPDDAREVLLIVNYPSGVAFLDLLSDRFFQATSLLRMAAVRDFSFALNQRGDGPERLERQTQSFDPSRAWAVYLFSSDRDIGEEIQTLRAIADKETITLRFASWRAAIVHSENSGGIREPLNYVTDRVAIFEADGQARLRAAVAGRFREFACSVSNSYIGLLNRMM